nr:PH domain-containing protein [Halomarina oriensis]
MYFIWRSRRKTRYIITTDRVIIKKGGWTGTSTDEYQISQIKRVQSSRGFKEKLLGGGMLTLDLGADSITIKGLPHFSRVKTDIQNAQRT